MPELDRLRADLAQIKAAGFNAIRTWSELGEDELAVVRESGLLIVFGIWVPPGDDFSDPQVIARDEALVRRVLSYSKRFDNIITYLIMNEPMPEHIRRVGAQATVDLWTKLEGHHPRGASGHPGHDHRQRGDRGVRRHEPVRRLRLQRLRLRRRHELHARLRERQPLPGRAERAGQAARDHRVRTVGLARRAATTTAATRCGSRADELLRDYRGILDSGASGACPFYYADGWWKSGNPAVHDDTPEEWFGFWGYADLKDTVGYPRPVWHALEAYNEALVASPKNGVFYQNEVPLEIFLQDDVARLRVIERDRIVFESAGLSKGYFSGKLSYAGEPLADRELVFEFYDAAGRLLKLETLVILTGKDPVVWPTLELRTATRDLAEGRDLAIDVTLRNDTPFTPRERAALRLRAAPGLGAGREASRRDRPREEGAGGPRRVPGSRREPRARPLRRRRREVRQVREDDLRPAVRVSRELGRPDPPALKARSLPERVSPATAAREPAVARVP